METFKEKWQWKYLHFIVTIIVLFNAYHVASIEGQESGGFVMSFISETFMGLFSYFITFFFIKFVVNLIRKTSSKVVKTNRGLANSVLSTKTAKKLLHDSNPNEAETRYNILFEEMPIDKLRARFFKPSLTRIDEIGKIFVGQAVETPAGKKRITGAFIALNSAKLATNKKMINDTIIRNDARRLHTEVPGYNSVKEQKVTMTDGRLTSLWHRTHLLPFRFGLSEGDDVPNLLFAGTAHLNSGSRPDQNYQVPRKHLELDSFYQRQINLSEIFNFQIAPVKIGDTIMLRDYRALDAPAGCNYSLDDFERLATAIIENSKSGVYRYGVFCNYENGEEVVPSSVSVYLIDEENRKLRFSVELPNVL